MRGTTAAIAYLDAPRMLRALSAGIGHVFQRREYLNRINVFPVPDGDTGTNMAFTFKTILEATATSPDDRVDELMDHVADAALDGARGNSGAIMAQYFHGFREAVSGQRLLTRERFAKAATAGAAAAWTAMSKPVPGTLPTVLEDFSLELTRRVAEGVNDIQALVRTWPGAGPGLTGQYAEPAPGARSRPASSMPAGRGSSICLTGSGRSSSAERWIAPLRICSTT